MLMDALRVLRPGLGQLGTHPPKKLVWATIEDVEAGLPEALPRVSVVIPSFNQGEFLDWTIRSVLDQNYPNLEIIVVDGGSKDNSVEIIRSFETYLAWWVSEPDQGQTSAINKGFSKATGDLMGWLNSDDLLAPGAIRRLVRHFHEHPETGALYGDRIVVNDRNEEIGRWVLPGHSPEMLKWVDFIPQETLYWRRSAWTNVGSALDERFHFAMDWDLLLRFQSANVTLDHIPAFLGGFRVHGSQKTSTQISSSGRREMNMLRERVLGRVPSPLEIRMQMLPYLLRAKCREMGRITSG